MRLNDMGTAHRQVLNDVSGKISEKLQAHFADASDVNGPNIGLEITERGKSVRMELPVELLQDAREDLAARHRLLIRIKGRRDRMLFKAPPDSGRAMRVESALPPQGLRPFGGGRGFRSR